MPFSFYGPLRLASARNSAISQIALFPPPWCWHFVANLQVEGHLAEQAHPREQDNDDVERVEHCANERAHEEEASGECRA